MEGIYGAHVFHADEAGDRRAVLIAADTHFELNVGTAHHQGAGLHFLAFAGLGQYRIGCDIFHVCEFPQVETPVLKFRPGFRHGIAIQVGHHYFARNHGVDGKENAASFLYLRSGFGLLPVHDAPREPSHEYGIHHLYLYVTCGSELLCLPNSQVGEVRCRHRFSVPGNQAKSYGDDNQQCRHIDDSRHQVLDNPSVFLFCHGCNSFFLAKVQKKDRSPKWGSGRFCMDKPGNYLRGITLASMVQVSL